MTTRQAKAFETVQTAIHEFGVLNDAFHEVCTLLRMAATGRGIQGEAAMTLEQLVSRQLLHSTFFSPGSAGVLPRDVQYLDLVVNRDEPPAQIAEEHWKNWQPIRDSFTEVIRKNPKEAQLAIERESLRPWFIGQVNKDANLTEFIKYYCRGGDDFTRKVEIGRAHV